MIWCRQATSHFLSQCWINSTSLFGITLYEHLIPSLIRYSIKREIKTLVPNPNKPISKIFVWKLLGPHARAWGSLGLTRSNKVYLVHSLALLLLSDILLTLNIFIINAFENIVCEIAAILSRGRWMFPYLTSTERYEPYVASKGTCNETEGVIFTMESVFFSSKLTSWTHGASPLWSSGLPWLK